MVVKFLIYDNKGKKLQNLMKVNKIIIYYCEILLAFMNLC